MWRVMSVTLNFVKSFLREPKEATRQQRKWCCAMHARTRGPRQASVRLERALQPRPHLRGSRDSYLDVFSPFQRSTGQRPLPTSRSKSLKGTDPWIPLVRRRLKEHFSPQGLHAIAPLLEMGTGTMQTHAHLKVSHEKLFLLLRSMFLHSPAPNACRQRAAAMNKSFAKLPSNALDGFLLA